MMDSSIPVLAVGDVEQTMQWYQTNLGFTSFPSPSTPPYDSAVLTREHIEIMIRKESGFTKKTGQASKWDAYIRSHGGLVEQLFIDLQGKVTILRPLESTAVGFIEFDIEDFNGYVLCFSE